MSLCKISFSQLHINFCPNIFSAACPHQSCSTVKTRNVHNPSLTYGVFYIAFPRYRLKLLHLLSFFVSYLLEFCKDKYIVELLYFNKFVFYIARLYKYNIFLHECQFFLLKPTNMSNVVLREIMIIYFFEFAVQILSF